MDSIKLNMLAADQLHPLLGELLQSLNRIKLLKNSSKDHLASTTNNAWKDKLKDWLIRLNKMNAQDVLNKEDARQLMFDLESAHSSFYNCLSQ